MKRILFAGLLAFAFTGIAVAAPTVYNIDPNHTQVEFSYSHFGFSHITGRFDKVEGEFKFDPADPTRSTIAVTIPMSSISTGVADLDEHLLSDDFFDAAKFPTATFKSSKVEAAGEGALEVAGDLTIHGVTQPVVLDVKINKVGEHPASGRAAAGFDASVTVKRSDFGVDKYVPNVSDEVRLDITLESTVPKQ